MAISSQLSPNNALLWALGCWGVAVGVWVCDVDGWLVGFAVWAGLAVGVGAFGSGEASTLGEVRIGVKVTDPTL